MKRSLSDTSDLKTYYNLDFQIPFEVDVEAGTSFGRVTEAKFNDTGNLTNLPELISYVENP